MSQIDKLAIMGIRSFENKHSETIKFYSPLTLVVGLNGSGKTTIIECLKYVLTGIQPPNSKVGGAFVHDPKLAGEREIMAQVKLQFKGTTGVSLVATRSLQLTVKKTTRSLKTLEGQLLVVRNNERTSISSRVAELDLLLPQYLGVSTAVIDNVIFCHQEESLWPMSDSSTLKKKFDEIFEAQKYTKAIANIKDIRKTHNDNLGKFKLLEQHAKQDKDRALKAEKRSVQLRDEIEALRDQVENLGKRMKQALDLAHKAHQESEDFARILGELEGKRIEARSKQATINDLQAGLKEMSESDEWLQNSLDQFEVKQKSLTETMKTKQGEYLACDDKIKQFRLELDKKLASRGKFQQEKEEYDRQISRRRNTIREIAGKHNIRGFEDLSDENLVNQFPHKIKKLAKDQQTAFDRAKREHDVEKRESQSQVNRLTERKAALQDNKVAAKRQIALNDREANEFQRKVHEIKVDEGNQAVLESRIEELNNKLENGHKSSLDANWPQKLNEVNVELRKQEDSASRMNDELIQSTKKAGEMARLAHLKQESKEKQRSLRTLLDAHGKRISSLIGQGWQSSTIEQFYQDAVNVASRDVTEAERGRDASTREVEQLQFKQKSMRESLAHSKEDASKAQDAIRKVIEEDPAEFEDALANAQVAADSVRSGTRGTKELHDYFVDILDVFNSNKPACRVCMRAFKSPTDPLLIKAKGRMEELVQKQLGKIAEEAENEAESYLQQLIDLKVDYETWKKVNNEIVPTLEQELEQVSQQRERVVAKVEKQDKIVQERQQSKKELDSLSKTVTSIGRCDIEVEGLDTQIKDLTERQSQLGGGRTLEEIREEISTATEQIRTTKKLITHFTSEQESSHANLNAMELELRDLRSELNTTNFQLDKKASLTGRVDEFKKANQKQRDVVDKADGDIGRIDPEILTAKAKSEDIVQRADAKEREMSHDLSRLLESVNALDLLNDQIQGYLDRGGDAQLSNTDREIKNLGDSVSGVTSEQGKVAKEVNKINDQIKDSESTRRQYSDNLRYRRDTRALQQLSFEIEQLTSHNAEVDRERLRAESEKYTREHNTLSAKQSGLMGEMRTKDAQLGEILADFETDFMDAPKRFKEAHIRVETTKAAVEDLARYGGALDKAIMKYHGLKMNEINGIIDDLWRRTYQGTDVDTVCIRADHDSGRGNRSYNYRVAMIKQGVEMDMRGRCSAGQKVLASIIIRLALAECFSANCGLIALDEPTTNLDRDNIISLAEALHDIIKTRQQQSNFQLIVITHDEEFLKAMKCADFTDYYYRVSRNERANSMIERQSIQEVM